MELYVSHASGLSFGGGWPVWVVGDFLLDDRRNFGSAVEDVSVELHTDPRTDTTDPRLDPDDPLYELVVDHLAARAKLPGLTFRRSARKVDIKVASDLHVGTLQRDAQQHAADLFRRATEEVVDALALLDRRIKPGDDFDLGGLLAHCRSRLARLPTTTEQIIELAEQVDAAQRDRVAELGPWERLDVDWSRWHADARSLLDAPFFWDPGDDFAPHGNDTGHDLLVDYRRWRGDRPTANPARFLRELITGWGFGGLDDMDEHLRDETLVALAFAQLKVDGAMAEAVADDARQAAARQRAAAEAATDWPHRAERLAALDRVDDALAGDA